MTDLVKGRLKIVRLVVIFVLIVIAIIYFARYASHRIKAGKSDDIVANMLIIEAKIKVINGNVRVNNDEGDYVGIKVSDIQDENFRKKLNDVGITEELYEKYYVLNKEHFNQMQILDELKNVDDKEYVVSYKDCQVLYINGINVNGNVVYKLSDVPKEMIDKNV